MTGQNTEQLPTTRAESRSVSPGDIPKDGLGTSTVLMTPETVKSILPPGVFMTSDHRYYWNGQGPVPSVTTILEVLSKPALVYWKASESVRALWRAITSPLKSEIPLLQDWTEEEAVKWALANVDSTRDKAAGIGTGVHLLADIVSRGSESAVDGFRPSEEEIPYVEAFRGFLAFLEAQGGRIVSSEHAVWSLNGYAGTYDLILEMPVILLQRIGYRVEHPELWLVDIKTSKGYYPEYGLQLAGYRWADYIVLPMDPRPYPMPEIHRTGVLHLRPDQYSDGWALVEYPTTYEQDYLTFLGCLEVWKWRKEERFSRKSLNTVIRS